MVCLSGLRIPFLSGVHVLLVGQRKNGVGIVQVTFQSVLQGGVVLTPKRKDKPEGDPFKGHQRFRYFIYTYIIQYASIYT